MGNALACATLTDDTNKITCHSKVHSSEDSKHTNLHANDWGDVDEASLDLLNKGIIHLNTNDATLHGEQPQSMATIDVEDLVGAHFNLPTSDGEPRDAEMTEAMLDHADGVNDDSTLTKFCCCLNNNDACQEKLSVIK